MEFESAGAMSRTSHVTKHASEARHENVDESLVRFRPVLLLRRAVKFGCCVVYALSVSFTE
jgi:hypothetical protein